MNYVYGLLHPRERIQYFVPLRVNKKRLMLDEGEVLLNVQGISMYHLSYRARGRGMLK